MFSRLVVLPMTEKSDRPGSLKKCPDCGIEMRLTENVRIRTGGKTGIWVRFGELSEEFLTVDVYFCPKCEQVRFYKPSGMQKSETTK